MSSAAQKIVPLHPADRLEDTLTGWCRAGAIARALDVTEKTIVKMVERGDLPPPARLSTRLHLYNVSAVRAALRRLMPEPA